MFRRHSLIDVSMIQTTLGVQVHLQPGCCVNKSFSYLFVVTIFMVHENGCQKEMALERICL